MASAQWNHHQVTALFETPFFELIHQAYQAHQAYFTHRDMELCALASIKTGACPEDCAYCPQSGHYKTGVKKEKLLSLEAVMHQAKQAKANGAQRFCMGAAWRGPPDRDFPRVLAMIEAVKALGLETCATLGTLTQDKAHALARAGLDFYNHNLDTSPRYYPQIISTRSYSERIETIKNVIRSGMRVCCGGILGMGETRQDRIDLLLDLNKLPDLISSIPINQLIPIPGTPLQNAQAIDPFEFVRTIAVARIMFPQARIRLAAGRDGMSEVLQAWCFMAGANSLFIGDKLLTARNPEQHRDIQLLNKLSLSRFAAEEGDRGV